MLLLPTQQCVTLMPVLILTSVLSHVCGAGLGRLLKLRLSHVQLLQPVEGGVDLYAAVRGMQQLTSLSISCVQGLDQALLASQSTLTACTGAAAPSAARQPRKR